MSVELDFYKRLHGADGDLELAIKATLAEGEFVAIYGPSGAGKTTLLRLLAGLTPPEKGVLTAYGVTWCDSARAINLPTQARDIAMVFQEYALFPNMSVQENLRYAMRDTRQSAELERLVELMQLGELRRRLPATLSGGQKQRVAVARALLRQAKILLLDEPFAALDASMRAQLQNEIMARQRSMGGITLLVSHDLAEVYRLAHRVLLLERGRLLAHGAPQHVLDHGPYGAHSYGKVVAADADDGRTLMVLVGNQLVKVACAHGISALPIGSSVVLFAQPLAAANSDLDHSGIA